MNELEREIFEKRLPSISRRLDYPRTPDISGSVMANLRHASRPRLISRGLVWMFTILLILFSSLMLIAPARAAIMEFIQIGIVRIFPRPAEVIHTPTADSFAPVTAAPSSGSSNLIPALDRIAGRTTLLGAQQQAAFPILLPSHPNDLGEPDHVFAQEAEGTMVILVWMDPQQPEQVLLSLHFIPSGSWAIRKMEPAVIQETSVNGQRGIWAAGPYALKARGGDIEFMRLIDGHVLIWAVDDLTYRLETDLPLEEALKISESLQPILVP